MNSLHRERKPSVRVQVHNSPPQYTPRTIPTSPDGLPTFEYDLETQLTDAKPNVRNNQAKRSLISLPIKTKNERDLKGKNPKEEQTTVTIGHKNQNKPHTVARQKEKTSLQINEERKKMMGKSLKVTDIGSLSPKQPRRSQTIKNEKTEIDYEWKTLLKNEFPPYNPLDFVPDERNSESIDVTKTCKIKKMHAMDENRELLEKIRQELDQWMAESSREGTCPEHWDTTQRECKDDAQTIMPTPNGQSTARLKPVGREEWGALEAKGELPPAPTPFSNIVIQWADVPACDTKQECTQAVRDIQNRHINYMAMPDIKYNFLIGGDGNVYEGRGWTKMAPPFDKDVEYGEVYNNNSLQIALVDVLNRRPTSKMTQAISELAAIGTVHKHLAEKFQTALLQDGKILRFVNPGETKPVGD